MAPAQGPVVLSDTIPLVLAVGVPVAIAVSVLAYARVVDRRRTRAYAEFSFPRGFRFERRLPTFMLTPEDLRAKLAVLFGGQDVEFDDPAPDAFDEFLMEADRVRRMFERSA